MGANPLVSPLIEPERPEPDELSRLNIAPESAVCDSVRDLLFDKTIPSFVLGKRRVVDRLELDRNVERRNAEARAALRDKTT